MLWVRAEAAAAGKAKRRRNMVTALVTGLIGISGLVVFMGFMLVWVKALPLIIIVVGVMALLIYDFVQTMRYGENGAGR
jgi:hypothetical protein